MTLETTRRGFLKTFGASVAATVVTPPILFAAVPELANTPVISYPVLHLWHNNDWIAIATPHSFEMSSDMMDITVPGETWREFIPVTRDVTVRAFCPSPLFSMAREFLMSPTERKWALTTNHYSVEFDAWLRSIEWDLPMSNALAEVRADLTLTSEPRMT